MESCVSESPEEGSRGRGKIMNLDTETPVREVGPEPLQSQ